MNARRKGKVGEREFAVLLREGMLVDATLIAVPSSTKNQEKERAPEMHQTRKGHPRYFGMKAHLGADRDRKLVHTVVVTAANVADVAKTAELWHGQEQPVPARCSIEFTMGAAPWPPFKSHAHPWRRSRPLSSRPSGPAAKASRKGG